MAGRRSVEMKSLMTLIQPRIVYIFRMIRIESAFGQVFFIVNSWYDVNQDKQKCDELGKDDCGSIQLAQRSKQLVYELKRGTKLDGRENARSKIVTWLRSRDCDIIEVNTRQRNIQREIRKDPYRGQKWKLNAETDCYTACGGGFCPSYCGAKGFCCSGDQSRNGNCPKSAYESFIDISPYPFGRHYCMTPGQLKNLYNGLQNFLLEKPIKVPDWGENKEKNCLLDCNGNQGSVSSFQ